MTWGAHFTVHVARTSERLQWRSASRLPSAAQAEDRASLLCHCVARKCTCAAVCLQSASVRRPLSAARIMSIKLRQAIDVIDSIIADVDAGRRLSAPDAAQPSQPAAGAPAGQPKKKDKKAKKDKAPADASKKPWLKDAAPATPALDPIQQADLRVACVLAVEAVDGSDKLWKCQVDCGDAEPRQIVAGLQQYISRDDMLKRSVVAICNLKAAKLAGQVSEGMLLAASSPDKGVVRTLAPPDGAEPGEQVRFEHSCISRYCGVCSGCHSLLDGAAVSG